jgi:hypothetical protein
MTALLVALATITVAATAATVYTTVLVRRRASYIRHLEHSLSASIPLRTPYQLEIEEPVRSLHTPLISGPDYTFAGPTEACLCGGELFHALVAFDEKKISYYILDGICHSCGATVNLPYETHDAEIGE